VGKARFENSLHYKWNETIYQTISHQEINMRYLSTRDTEKKNYVSSAFAIKQGLAPDGGLYVPESFPSVTPEFIASLADKSYVERAVDVLSLYLTDYSREELVKCCSEAYAESSFPGGAAPLYKIDNSHYTLELWHGPTCAFKDMALQLMPRLLSLALGKTGEEKDALILVATSGDTGKAALEGYKDVDRIKICVFFPVDGVSRVQKLQMTTQSGNNVGVSAIVGNFDDCQNGVKQIFGDKKANEAINKKGYVLSSANSINWGRLVPQIVYYFSAYADLVKEGRIKNGDKINFCVPTGNFGNIFAGYCAYRMGLPINRFICASNKNNVLTDFFETGVYDRNRKFYTTASPSMDILISSNLERLLWCAAGSAKTVDYMTKQKADGIYKTDDTAMAEIRNMFSGYYADDIDCAKTIRNVWNGHKYLIDTHTAVGVACVNKYREDTEDETLCVTDSTASPFKFSDKVYEAVTGKQSPEGYAALSALEAATELKAPAPLCGLDKREVRFTAVARPEEMFREVLGML